MMRCNKCGAENEDDARFCQACGHKLRSRAASPLDASAPPEVQNPGETLDPSAPGACHGCGKYLEALIYAAILAAGVTVALMRGNITALYVLAGVVGLVAWLRRI